MKTSRPGLVPGRDIYLEIAFIFFHKRKGQ